jgi:hypothetical protein
MNTEIAIAMANRGTRIDYLSFPKIISKKGCKNVRMGAAL